MEAFINEKKVKFNAEVGRWLSLGGLGVLIVGMVVSITKPQLVLVSMGCLLLGFLASTVGAYYANHWTRGPRADEVLTRALKGMSNQYHLYHYLLPAPHVLLGPSGFYLFRACAQEGKITFDGKKWRQKFNFLRSLGFSGQDALGDPIRDVQDDMQRFSGWLSKRLSGQLAGASEIPSITPLVIFVRDNVELDVVETEIPVMTHKQLKKYIRNIVKDGPGVLSDDDLYGLERAMLGDQVDEL